MSSGRRSHLHTALLAVVAVSCVLAPLLTQLRVDSPLRAASVLVLFLLAPGAALLPLIWRSPVGYELALVLATSLAVTALIAQSMLWLGAWNTSAATWLLGVLSLISVAPQLVLRLLGRAGYPAASHLGDG